MVIGAGCTQSGNTNFPTPASPSSPALTPSPGLLALTAADAPVNYTIAESRMKTSAEVGTLAKDLGWQGGYIVKFSSQPGTGQGPTEIIQNIVTYPVAALPQIMQVAEASEKADAGMVFTSLPAPGLGESGLAFSGKANTQAAVQQNTNPLVPETASVSVKQDMVEIIFIKGSPMEVLRMNGPGADYAILRGFAETAYAKIP